MSGRHLHGRREINKAITRLSTDFYTTHKPPHRALDNPAAIPCEITVKRNGPGGVKHHQGVWDLRLAQRYLFDFSRSRVARLCNDRVLHRLALLVHDAK